MLTRWICSLHISLPVHADAYANRRNALATHNVRIQGAVMHSVYNWSEEAWGPMCRPGM